MELKLHRIVNTTNETLGSLEVSDDHFCFTLEDERREIKVKSETCISAGRYRIKLRTEGGMNQKYTAKFPSSHRGMLWLQDVPDFEWVYIHIGNIETNTDGCVLVGYGVQVAGIEKPMVTHSTPAYIKLAGLVYAAIDAGEEVWITIYDKADS